MAADAVGRKHHSSFHRLFAKSEWCLDELGLAVFDLISWRLREEMVMLAVDDTLARKRGLKVYGAGMHHDPMISTRKVARLNWGHSWVVLSVMTRLPFGPDRCFALPIPFRLYGNRQTVSKIGGGYRTCPELAVEMLQALCRTYKNHRFYAVADSTCAGQSVQGNLPKNCDLTSRLDLDARLYDPRAGRERTAPQTRSPAGLATRNADGPDATDLPPGFIPLSKLHRFRCSDQQRAKRSSCVAERSPLRRLRSK